MTQLFSNLQESIIIGREGYDGEWREYGQMVAEALKRVRVGYEDRLKGWTGEWVKSVEQIMDRVITTSQYNQIRPKLELIYTSFINQEQTILREIENIGKLLCSEQKHFQHLQELQRPSNTQEFFHHTATQQFRNRTSQNTFTRTAPKNRSLSFGNGKRKLSKNSCFAEAKKVEVPRNNFSRTATQQFLKVDGNQRVKKGKKRQENGFKQLDKCLSSTSPSNFMMAHMKNMKNTQGRVLNGVSKSKTKERSKSKEVQQQPQITIHKAETEPKIQREDRIRSNSGSYQKIISNVEEKISSKLDQLMSKYSEIQQRLQRAESIKATTKPKNEPIETTSKGTTNQRNLTTISQNVSEVMQIPRQEVTYIDRQPSKVKHLNSLTKQNRTIESSLKGSNSKSVGKAIINKNKIIRNNIQESPQQGSLQCIRFSQNAKKQAEKDKVNIQNTKVKQKCQQEIDKEFIEGRILQFHENTTKIILPISKKLLQILKSSYISFCSKHKMPQSSSIISIETDVIEDQRKQMKDHLQKMKKLMKLNCSAQKKQKLLVYFDSFLNTYLMFDQKGSINTSEPKNNQTEILIEQALAKFIQ